MLWTDKFRFIWRLLKIKEKQLFWSRVVVVVVVVFYYFVVIILEIFIWDLFLLRLKIIIYPFREEHKIWVTTHLELLGMKIPNFLFFSGVGGPSKKKNLLFSAH